MVVRCFYGSRSHEEHVGADRQRFRPEPADGRQRSDYVPSVRGRGVSKANRRNAVRRTCSERARITIAERRLVGRRLPSRGPVIRLTYADGMNCSTRMIARDHELVR